jgi:hypothetical protein
MVVQDKWDYNLAKLTFEEILFEFRKSLKSLVENKKSIKKVINPIFDLFYNNHQFQPNALD